ncbi:MAG TPA: peptidylprolyl isomerase [Nanoarchaeota archaeon]|nr:peptidylprolyl isomerase [Nanoarchaeota archaeon]HIH34786.1 peptidylprolyl isomerase [Nanoarchaeota archaeon]HIH51218.1 peptidylprolyl isomerase [Nanoarchaeota archaeon]HIH65872.1 peptidylprolyl isomerase [Nanoarchaeota archaeon]
MKKSWIFIVFILIIGLLIFAMVNKGKFKGSDADGFEGGKVLLETTMGNITIELRSDMPITVGNFRKLVSQGYYDGIIFHRVIKGFMIQGGDPTGTGAGGPGYKIKDEFTSTNQNDRGTISMANAGPDSGGSQFFINLVDNNFLDSKHPAFGKVVSGIDVVDKIAAVGTDSGDRPVTEVKIVRAQVVEI